MGMGTDEKSVSIEGNFDEDYVDIFYDAHGQKIVEVDYTFVDFKDFLFYVHISCFDEKSKTNVWRWISLKNERIVVSDHYGELEKAYPVKSVCEQTTTGKGSTLKVDKAFEELFGKEELHI